MRPERPAFQFNRDMLLVHIKLILLHSVHWTMIAFVLTDVISATQHDQYNFKELVLGKNIQLKHEGQSSSPFMRRQLAGKPIGQFMFTARVGTDEKNIVSAQVAYDAKLAKLRVDLVVPEEKRKLMQIFDLKQMVVYHKLPIELQSSSCSASLIKTNLYLTIEQLLLGSCKIEYVGSARSVDSGEQVNVYRTINSGLPFWLDQHLDGGHTPEVKAGPEVAGGEGPTESLFYFSVVDEIEEKLLKIEVNRRRSIDGQPVVRKQEISFDRFDWNLDNGPNDPSALFSLASECADGKSHKVSLEMTSFKWQDMRVARRRNLVLLHSLQTSLSLASPLVFDLNSELDNRQEKDVISVNFKIQPWTKGVGSCRKFLDGDGTEKSKKTVKLTIENIISASLCYHFASTLHNMDTADNLSQIFFAHDSESETCHLADRPSSLPKSLLVFTMRKLPLQMGANLDKWTKSGLNPWLSLACPNVTYLGRLLNVELDGKAVKLLGDNHKREPGNEHHNYDNVPHDEPEIVPSHSIGSVAAFCCLKMSLVLVVLLIANLKRGQAERKSMEGDSNQIVVRYLNKTIETGRREQVSIEIKPERG